MMHLRSYTIFCLIFSVISSSDDVVVETNLGPVAGSLRTTASGQLYHSFQGLPYAAPPVGSLRLLPPQTHSPWSDVLDLSEDSEVMCPQLSETVSGKTHKQLKNNFKDNFSLLSPPQYIGM